MTPVLRNVGLIALGSNVASQSGGPVENVQEALRLFAVNRLRIAAQSRFYRTPAFPPGTGPDFVNAAVIVETELDPEAVLERLHSIEAGLGRERVQRWGQRTIDLDLLAMGETILPDAATVAHWIGLPFAEQKRTAPEKLILPHPRLHERAFVLIPLAEIAPAWRHPLLGLTVRDMADALSPEQKTEVRPLPGGGAVGKMPCQ
jgi:2-amino-4-hydroxy-6-hydroxymethyldihydropteridine diphosphokinase